MHASPPYEGIEIDRRSTPGQIASGLTRLVLSGRLPPGRPLSESAIARELKVSRNTVREAVRLLERGGLVRYELNRGVVVQEPSDANVSDVYRARRAIEVGAVSTDPRAPDAGDRVVAALATLRTALSAGDPEAAIVADLDFHATLVSGAGSARLDAAFAPVANELRLYLTILSAHGGYRETDRLIAEHVEITEAFTSGDRQLAALVVGDHIAANAASVIEIVRRRRGR